jgi:hypothetical protein
MRLHTSNPAGCVNTGIRVIIFNSIPSYGTGRADATMLAIGSVDTNTNADVDADGLSLRASEE